MQINGISPAPKETLSEPSANGSGQTDRRQLILHPCLFTVHPLLSMFVRNAGEMSHYELTRPMLVGLLGTVVTWAAFSVAFRSIRRGAVMSTALVLAFSSRGHMANVLVPAAAMWVVPTLSALLLSLGWYLLRTSKPLSDLNKVLNVSAAVLVLPLAVPVGQMMLVSRTIDANLRAVSPSKGEPGYVATAKRTLIPTTRTDLPDIYCIVLDAYGRYDSLQRVMRWDNSTFLDDLQRRDFYVADRSSANYNQTPLCLASLLNMTELDGQRMESFNRGLFPARMMMQHNRVAAELAMQGYQFVYLWTGEPLTEIQTPDVLIHKAQPLSNLERQMLGQSAANGSGRIDSMLQLEQRGQILSGFESLSQLSEAAKSPKFVLAHFSVPHPPFVFEADGSDPGLTGRYTTDDGSILMAGMSRETYVKGYTRQLQFVNKKVMQCIDAILAKSKLRPIIILQGDHGSRMGLDWESREKTDLDETFSIFNAYLVPETIRAKLYPEISPVNSFRVILSGLFGMDLPKVPDRSFYSTLAKPNEFEEVTGLLGRGR